MDVLNFGHGAFIAVGAFVAASVMLALAPWMTADSIWLNLAAHGPAVLAAMVVSGVLGLRLRARHRAAGLWPAPEADPGDHRRPDRGRAAPQGDLGPDQITLSRPTALRGAFLFGDVAIEKYRVLAVVVGLVVFAALALTLNRTRLGLLIRAGVENGEMVEALGYRIRRLFVGVFVVGSALAGLGGAMWGLYQETVTAAIGAQVAVLVFIVIIIGGLGSVGGCFVGALLVGLTANYIGFLAPKVRAGLQHPADGAGPAVAAAGPLSRGEEVEPMLRSILSDDLPRSRWLALALVAILVGLAVAPFLVSGRQVAERRGQDLRLHRAGRVASTCCWATPASSPSPTRCSSASAPTVSPSR